VALKWAGLTKPITQTLVILFFEPYYLSEDPNPTIFLEAYQLLHVKPEEAVPISDDRMKHH
jgi:beta-phosphoglucomutase-like phosphatase (HAD superfamily)